VMRDLYISALETSFERFRPRFKDKLELSFNKDKADPNLLYFTSAAINFKTDLAFGLIVIYDSGFYDIHVMNNDENYDSIFIETHTFTTEDALNEIVEGTLQRVIALEKISDS